jgi:prepilin-type N-terminal cleavage/methylation domain-containing protein
MKKNAGGFTLVELMVVVAIVSILSAIAAPSVMTIRSKYKLRNAGRELLSTMRKARSLALMHHRDVELRFENQTYYLDDATRTNRNPLPANCGSITACYGAGIEIGIPGSSGDPITFTNNALTFTAMGLPKDGNTGWVYLRNQKGAGFRIGVQGVVGNIKMEQCGTTGVTCP